MGVRMCGCKECRTRSDFQNMLKYYVVRKEIFFFFFGGVVVINYFIFNTYLARHLHWTCKSKVKISKILRLSAEEYELCNSWIMIFSNIYVK